MRKIIIGVLLIILIAVGGFMYVNRTNSLAPQDDVVIKTVVTYWPGNFWKEIAQEKGWFKEAGLNVELVDGNQDYYQSLQDAADGKIHANAFPLFDFIQYLGNGADLVAIINTDVSAGIDGIIAKPQFTTVASLKGKRIAVPKGTFGEYLLTVALERNNLSPADVIIVDAKSEEAHQALINGTADAAVTYEPHLSKTVQSIGAKRLFDTSEVLGINSSVEAFHDSFIKEHPQAIQKYVAVWHKTTKFIQDHPTEAYEIIAQKNNTTVADVEELVKGDLILNLEDNKTAFTYAVGYSSLYTAFQSLNRFMLENNLVSKELDESLYFNNTFIRNIE